MNSLQTKHQKNKYTTKTEQNEKNKNTREKQTKNKTKKTRKANQKQQKKQKKQFELRKSTQKEDPKTSAAARFSVLPAAHGGKELLGFGLHGEATEDGQRVGHDGVVGILAFGKKRKGPFKYVLFIWKVFDFEVFFFL